MIKRLKNEFKTNYKFYLILLFIYLLFAVNLDYYIYSPGGLIELTDRIEVENSYKQDGSFNMTYVTARRGSIANILLSYIISDWDIESLDESRLDNESAKEIETRDKIYLKETSYDAIIAAFSEAGLPYNIDRVDVTVTYVFSEAKTDIKTNDIITNINGKRINSLDELRSELDTYKVGDSIKVKALRNNKEIECESTLIDLNDRASIGISLAELKTITTDPKVEFIFKNNESGSSRGLMSALDIYNKITEYDLTKGRTIAGTGSIDAEGNVGSISGVKYKLKGAVKKHADVFIVPESNYEEAMKIKNDNNYNIEIISADNLHNVVEKLK